MSSIETYVVVSHEKFMAMEEELRQKTSPPRVPTPPPPSANDDVDEGDQEEDAEESALTTAEPKSTNNDLATAPSEAKPLLSKESRDLVTSKSIKNRAFHKFLQAIATFANDKLNISNVDDLVKNALSQSKRLLPNETEFYAFLLKHSLIHLVTIDNQGIR